MLIESINSCIYFPIYGYEGNIYTFYVPCFQSTQVTISGSVVTPIIGEVRTRPTYEVKSVYLFKLTQRESIISDEVQRRLLSERGHS